MAPTAPSVLEWQTNQIVKFLLEDEDDRVLFQCRQLDAGLEVDSPAAAAAAAANSDEDFDPVLIADKLKRVADALNEDAKFKAALADLKKAAAQEALEAAFSQSVETICQTQTCQKAEVAPEMQLIRASVAFLLYVKKASPELKTKVQSAMTAFLTRRVGPWVTQQGGWDKVMPD